MYLECSRPIKKVVIELPTIEKQVGDAGQILDTMAVMLENISSATVIARTTIAAVFRTAQIVASIPNLSYKDKARKYTL